MSLDTQTTVREIVLENPRAARTFESFGIDYCCGGKRALEEACREASVSLETVLHELQQQDASAEVTDDDWRSAPLAELADHIVSKHHAFVRQESPRLTALLVKVRTRHGNAHGELGRVEELFEGLASELALHMLKEEQVLFPMIKALATAPAGTGNFHGIEFPVRRMMEEHDDAGEALRGIRELTGQFQPPTDACTSFRALYHGLLDFEQDLHRHIHLENNILFPRAVGMA